MKKFTEFINESSRFVADKPEKISGVYIKDLGVYDAYFKKGDVYWLNDQGRFDRKNGPAVEYVDGRKEWYKNGQHHRKNGPAVERADGSKEWWINGNLHREDGPAIEYADGGKEWRINGNLHREDGPAVEYADGSKYWWIHGNRHRLDGPAVEHPAEENDWYINNKSLYGWGEPEIKLLIANNNIHDILKYPEIREKLKKFKYLLKPEDRILLDFNWSKKI